MEELIKVRGIMACVVEPSHDSIFPWRQNRESLWLESRAKKGGGLFLF